MIITVTSHVAKVFDIHTDHLNTPRVITDSNGTPVWRWDSAPFGETLPDENPQKTGNTNNFVFNLRFAGLYFDRETNLHYNYFRDYDPQTGRYIQIDPIGLYGGMNTYGYVAGNPVSFVDPQGLTAEDIERMRNFAKCTQPDLNIPDFKVVPTGNPALRGYTYPYPYLAPRLSDVYLKELSPSERFDLYDTIVHESVHYNYPWYRRGSPEYLYKVHRNNNEMVRNRTQPWEKKIMSGDTQCPPPPSCN